jgi:hypothetical protein
MRESEGAGSMYGYLVIHGNRSRIRDSDKEVHKIPPVHHLCYLFQDVHQPLGQPLLSAPTSNVSGPSCLFQHPAHRF